jgi:two-component system phosphate regulon sensor histidine kinase PhoR
VRLRIQHPIFAGFALVITLLVALIALLLGNTLAGQLRSVYRAELTRDLQLAADVLAQRSQLDADSLEADVVAAVIGERLGYRVTLIDSAGDVIGDSEVPRVSLPAVENHRDRPEVVEAWERGFGFSERQSETVGFELLYGAMRATLNEQPIIVRVAAPLAAIDATVLRAQGAVLAAGLFALAFAAVAAFLLGRVLKRPLLLLTERAGALAQGDFSKRVRRVSPVAELDDLALAFDRLADELEARLWELGRERDEMRALIDTMAEGVVALTEDARVLRINRAARRFLAMPDPPPFAPVSTLIRQPDIRELLEESVVHAVPAREVRIGERHFIATSRLLDRGGSVTTFLEVSENRRLEQVRRDFVANVSHELKTPLTSIRGFAETLIDDDPPEPLRKQFLDNVRRNTLRLQRLVDDLLDLSRLESGRWEIHVEPLEVGAAAREAWRSQERTAQEKGVSFAVDGTGLAQADDTALAQIFQNLFDNALRYTSDGGRIRVVVAPRDGTIEVSVIDTGSGIPARSLPRMFERFYRVDPARSREEGGTGLGLAIVRHLVQGMGGEVTADSELGRGTVIRFTLPAASGPT